MHDGRIIELTDETEKAISFLRDAIEEMAHPESTPDTVMLEIELALRRIQKIQIVLAPFCQGSINFHVTVR